MASQRPICLAALCILASTNAAGAATFDIEATPLYTTANDPALHITGTGGAFDGVVKLTVGRPGGIVTCTGVLLNGGRDILTAAHCLTDGQGNLIATSSFSLFQTAYGAPSLPSSSFTVHPDWDGEFNTGNDIAIVHLSQLAPLGAIAHEIYRGSDEVGQVVTKAGYGLSGTGLTGDDLPAGTRRSGMNTYDALGDVFTGVLDAPPVPGSQLVYDFDDGTAAHDAFEFFGALLGTRNINHLGLGDDEVLAAQGDSGGPTFINNQIAGITSYGLRLTNVAGNSSDIDGVRNASFGEFVFDTRVSYYADWIDANLSTPPPFFAGDLNGDGFVGIDDLNLVLDRWNQDVSATPVPLAGDPTGDGFVGIDDLNVVLSEWNQGTPPGSAGLIPEPVTGGILVVGWSVMFARRA